MASRRRFCSSFSCVLRKVGLCPNDKPGSDGSVACPNCIPCDWCFYCDRTDCVYQGTDLLSNSSGGDENA